MTANLKQKLAHPLFISALALLVLNDWFLKQTFANGLTGKLSDVAGLFAFPFFLSALFPRHALKMYVATALLFIVWKSTFVQPIIDVLNSIGIPVNRTVDYADLFTLIVLPISWCVFERPSTHKLKPALLNLIAIVAALAFTATSMPKGKQEKFTIDNKSYTFNCSRRELVSRWNSLQLEYLADLNKYSGRVDFDSKNNSFHYTGANDTLATMIDNQKYTSQDSIPVKSTYAEFIISGNNRSSEIKLVSLIKFVPGNIFVHANSNGDEKCRQKAIRFFERNVVKALKNYRHSMYRNDQMPE